MKGIFFQQPLEFRLEVEGDEWFQGDTLSGVLSVKNRGSATEPLGDLYLHLACGKMRKVRQKAADAFEIVASAELSAPAAIEAEKQESFPWSFQLDKNCVISDKGQSLHLVCGRTSDNEAAGQLTLPVLPHAHIEAVVSLLEASFSFVLKGQKSKTGWVEAKLKPPSGKQYPTLEHLLLCARFEDNVLQLKYCFNVKKLEATASTLGIKKATTEFEQQLDASQYLFPGGDFVNHEPLEAAIAEALQKVQSGF